MILEYSASLGGIAIEVARVSQLIDKVKAPGKTVEKLTVKMYNLLSL